MASKPTGSLQTHPSSGVNPFPTAPSGLKNKHPFDWQVAAIITRRMCDGEYLINICKEFGMTLDEIDVWSKKKPKFGEWIRRARQIQTEAIMERSITVFDDELPMEEIPTKGGNVVKRPSMAGVQNRIAQSRAMQIFAARWNPKQFGDRVEVGGSVSLVAMLSEATKKQLKRVKPTAGSGEPSKAIDVNPKSE